MRHWFNQHIGKWPVAACGHKIGDELADDYTLWMSRVSCPGCKAAVQLSIGMLASEPMPLVLR